MPAPEPDRIRLSGLRFDATHGVYDFERRSPQAFVVDVTCWLTPRQPSDDLATTLDYAALCRRIADDMTGEPVNLLETLAERVASTCLQQPLVSSVEVTVHKPDAPLPVPVTDVAVTISRSRA